MMRRDFFRFWYAFAFTNYSALESGDADGVCDFAVMPSLHEFAACTFEDVCRQYIQELQKVNALPFRYARIGRFFGKTTVRDASRQTGIRVAESAEFYYALFLESGFDDKVRQ